MNQQTTTSKPTEPSRPLGRVKVGTVESISGAKTVRVRVIDLIKHPFYGKYVKRRTRLLVHDPKAEAKVGDTVEVAPCRPISKSKAWRLVRVTKRAVIV